MYIYEGRHSLCLCIPTSLENMCNILMCQKKHWLSYPGSLFLEGTDYYLLPLLPDRLSILQQK